jgi:hypothetical protein
MKMKTGVNLHLVTAIVDLAIFLEFSNDDEIDPDAAVTAMEHLGGQLLQLDADTKAAFIDKLKVVAMDYAGEKADFVRDLPEILGFE